MSAPRKALLYLILVGLFLFLTGPFLWLLVTSLKTGDLYRLKSIWDLLPLQPDLTAYGKVVQGTTGLGRMVLNTVFICALGVGGEIVIASLAAYPLARMEFPGKNLIFGALLATMMLPAQANMIVNFTTIRTLGLYDTLIAVVLPSLVSVFGIFLMRQAYLVIPRELEDAARIDGCSELRLWWSIMLPQVAPAVATLAVFGFVGHWNSLIWPLVVLKSESNYPIAVGLTWLQGAFATDFRVVAAGSVLATVPIILVFVFLQRFFIKGISAGAVKG